MKNLCMQTATNRGALEQVSHCGYLGKTLSVCLILPNLLCCVEVHHFQFTHFSANRMMVYHYVSL